MRVVAGSAGGVHLLCPKSGHVRPTMDQVRAAVFSSLAERVPDARVLDLFAGTGGLGIEALSRGAARATFVERDRRTVDCIRTNLERTRLGGPGTAEVVCLDVFTFLTRASRNAGGGEGYDLIFADPPYTGADQPEDFSKRLVESVALADALRPGGLFVLEKSPRHALPDLVANGWEIVRQKGYGKTEVTFLVRIAGQTPPALPDAPPGTSAE